MQDTKEIFTALNSEICTVSTAIGSIGTEITDLEKHKDIIADSVDHLNTFAMQNAEYGEKVNQDMQDLENSMATCKDTTTMIVDVSEELVGEIHKFNNIRKIK